MTGRLAVTTGIIAASAVLITANITSIYKYAYSEDIPSPMYVQKEPGLTVGWVGDMVPSEDSSYNALAFSAVAQYTQTPELMIGNLEGTFAQEDRVSKCTTITTLCHAFRGSPNFAQALKDAGFDFVSLVNNHSYDYGREGLTDTKAILDAVGLPYIASDKPTASIVVEGKRVGILGLSSTPPQISITDYSYIKETVTKLKKENDYVIVIFHGGAEGSDKTTVPNTEEYVGSENRGNVALVAHTAIDAGADLVLGSGPHVLRKIEEYNGKTIAYSLGNFVGGKHLVMGGNLSRSGIFFANLDTGSHSFLSILLSSTGVPHIDLSGASALLLKSLE